MNCIGVAALVEHIFYVFANDISTETLPDVRQRIINHIDTLFMDDVNTSKAYQTKLNRSDIIISKAFPDQVSIDHFNIRG